MHTQANMKYTTIKLDRRHKGHNHFTHYIAPRSSLRLADKLDFFEWRKWCWESFGPGYERDIAGDLNYLEHCRWAWHTEHGSRRLYFASPKELNWFNLKWSSDV